MYPDLKGKLILITGAAGNLAGGVVRFFDNAGADLALFDLKEEFIRDSFGEALNPAWGLYGVDITDPAAVTETIGAVLDRFGRLDVLVNLAGGYAGGKDTSETEVSTWERMMNLNAKSVFLMSQAALKPMLAAESGCIINIGAKPGLAGTRNHSAYAASKSAVLRLTESMAAEFGGSGVRVNAVIPSTIDTPANRKAMPDADFSAWVTPDSLAGVIGFLASEAARDINGALIPVYGR